MTDKSFPITLVVSPVTPEDDYYIDVDPLDLGVEQGEIARFVIALSGNYAGGIGLEVMDAPSGAKVGFDVPNPVSVSDVVVMSVDTSDVFPGKYEMFVRATPMKDDKLTARAREQRVASGTPDKAVVVTSKAKTDSASVANGDIAERSANVASLAADVATQAADVADELSKMQK